jgi:transposase
MPRLTAFQREVACGLLDQGLDAGVVARRLQCDVTTIMRLRRRVAATGYTADRTRSGRPRVTSSRQDRHILLTHSRDRFESSVATARQTVGTHGRPIAPHTVRRRLRERGLRARIPYRGPILDRGRRNLRLEWARLHQRWTLARWRSVLFTDESRICVDRPDRRTRVWRRQGERFQDGCVQEADRWGGASIMVWAGISYDARTPLVIVDGTLNAQRYVEEILEPILLPSWINTRRSGFSARQRPSTFCATDQGIPDKTTRSRYLTGPLTPQISLQLSICGTS